MDEHEANRSSGLKNTAQIIVYNIMLLAFIASYFPSTFLRTNKQQGVQWHGAPTISLILLYKLICYVNLHECIIKILICKIDHRS